MSAHVLDLLTSNADLLDQLEDAVRLWRNEHGRKATRSASDLAKIIGAALSGLRATNAQARDDAMNGAPDPDVVLSLNNKAFFVRDLIRVLEFSSRPSLHPVLTPAIQAQLGRLRLRGQVLVSGILSSHAYEEYSYELATLTRELFLPFSDPAQLEGVTWPLLVFRIPSPPIEWPLFHTLMFHEIGHALFRAHKERLQFPGIPGELEQAVTAAGADLVKHAQAVERLRSYMVTALKWTEELFADAVGVLMAGPAFVTSFCRMLTAFRSDTASDTHPPTIFRVRLLVNALRARALVDPLPPKTREVIEGWENEAKRVTDFPPAAGTRPLFRGLPAHLARECEAVHGALLAQTAGILADVVLTPEQLQLDLERGRRLLDLRIPPVEEELRPTLDTTPTALSAPRVFSSCWAAYYLGVEAGKTARENLAQTSAALLDSLDAAEAIRAWERAK